MKIELANPENMRDPNWESKAKRDAARGQPWPSGRGAGGGDQASNHFPPPWMPFDLSSQMYLNMGPKPKMRSHFRSHKMALWLNLIPQLHHSQDEDDTSPHHEFHETGPHHYAGATLNKSIVDPYWRMGAVWSKSALHTAAVPSSLECDPPTADGLSPSSLSNPSLSPSPSSRNSSHAEEDEGGEEVDGGDYVAALSITVTLGVVLLLLNAAVLVAGVLHHYRQRERETRRAKKKGKKCSEEVMVSGSSEQGSDRHLRFGDFLEGVPDPKKDYVSDVSTELGLVFPRTYPDVMGHDHSFMKDSSRSLEMCCVSEQVRLKRKSQITSTFGGTMGSLGALYTPDASSLSRKRQASGTSTFPRSKPSHEPLSPRTPSAKRRVQEISV